MEHLKTIKKYAGFFLLILLIYILLIQVLLWFKVNGYLWFDEAGQFWISKGLNHYSDPMQPEQGVSAVIENNAYYNMDPGGFSLLLHFWGKVFESTMALRYLPYTFFLLTIAACIILFYQWTKNVFIAALAGFIPLFIPVAVNLALELRAYSMEMLGTVTGLISITSLQHKLTYKRLLLWSCVLSFFMTSRYTEIIIVFVYSLAILNIIICSAFSKKQKIIGTILYSLPLLITLACIYYFSLSVQNPGVSRMFYLTYLDTEPGVILQPRNLIYLLAVAGMFFLLLLSNRYPLLKRYQLLLFSAFTINAIFLILSFAGKHPWKPVSAACISMFLVTVICIAALFTTIVFPFFKNKPGRFYFTIPVLVVLIVINIPAFTNRPRHHKNIGFDASDLSKYKKIYVEAWDSPSLRHAFEYGMCKGWQKDFYPGHFIFEKHGRHNIAPGSNHPSLSKQDTLPSWEMLRQYDALIGDTFYRIEYSDSLNRIIPPGYFNMWEIKRDTAAQSVQD